MSDHSAVQKPLNKRQWWGCFLFATYVMSLWFQASRTFFQVLSFGNGLALFALTLLLAMIMMVLIYDSYVQEKNRQQVQKPIRFFEWLMTKRFLLREALK